MNKKLLTVVALVTLLLPHVAAAFTQEKDGIQLNARHYAPDELVIDADSDGWQIKVANLEQKGFKPVHISVQNSSKEPIAISAQSVVNRSAHPSLGMLSVLSNYKFDLKKQIFNENNVIGFLVMGINLYMFRNFLINFGATAKHYLLFGGLFSASIAGGICYELRKLKHTFDTLLKKQLLSGVVIVQPGESVEKTLFFESGANNQFTFRVFNALTHETVTDFNVDLMA